MISALMSMVLSSLSTIFNKKALSYSTLSNLWYKSFAAMWGIVILAIFIGFLWVNIIPIFITPILFLCIIYVIIALYGSFLSQNIYRTEKISNILPFVNINKVFTIVIWFLIWSDASYITFIMGILCGIIVILFSIDFKKLKFPKSFSKLIYYEFVISLETLITVYILTLIDFKELFSMYYILLGTIIFVALIIKRELWSLCTQSKLFYKNRIWVLISGQSSFIISLFLIQWLWVTISVLLSFLGIVVTLIFSYFFFKDIPSKKNILQILIISILVWIWFIFK